MFLTRSLHHGGAERQLTTLAIGLKQQKYDVSVAAFYGNGTFETNLAAANIPVFNLNKQGRWDTLGFFIQLFRLIKQERPAIVHSYLAIPNILAATIKILNPKIKILWGIRASEIDLEQHDWLTRVSYKIEALMSRLANNIIANSQAGRSFAIHNGFSPQSITVIANGIDTEYFKIDTTTRLSMRHAWGIQPDEVAIGIVGRLDPVKEHKLFLDAAAQVAATHNNVKFICVGDGPSIYTSQLKRDANDRGLNGRIVWLSAQDNMPPVYNSLDILVSSSSSEGFSNVIAEAMSCGIPCVATKVGDSTLIVGETGIMVPPKNAPELASALRTMIDQPTDLRHARGASARARVESLFSIAELVRQTEEVMEKL
ncbi:glycosyltransferase [Hydrogenophaga sp. OTU3427]|uniref:glycosyltransferase n=1 Tax=Hydrogenophaga sp. OTU3427 TaxID=3043856 RepID=UPI00313C4D80